jgi:hypothetical protein
MTSTDEQPEAPEASQPPPDDSQPTAAQPSPSGTHFWLRIALPLAVLLIAVVATVYMAAGGTSHSATSGTSLAVPGTSASHAPGTPPAGHGNGATGSGSGQAGGAPAGGGQASGLTGSAAHTKLGSTALPLPKKLQAAVARWDAGRGGAALAAISSQFGTALQAADVKQYVPMRIACVKLAGKVATAQAGPAIPDAAMQKQYAKALADFAQGADDCKAAISERSGDETIVTKVNPAQLHRSLSLIGAGATDLWRATAEIVARRHH